MREGKGKTRISVMMNEQDARDVINSYATHKKYLENLIMAYVPDSDPTQMEYSELRHHGYVIKGVAEKILKNTRKKGKQVQLSLFR